MKDEQGIVTHEHHVAFLFRVDEAVQESVMRVKQLKPPSRHQWSAQLEAVVQSHQGLASLSQLHHDLPQEGRVSVSGADALMRAEQMEGLQLLGSLELPARNRRAELYQQVEQVYRAYGVFALAALELNLLSDEQADASVDSEFEPALVGSGPVGSRVGGDPTLSIIRIRSRNLREAHAERSLS